MSFIPSKNLDGRIQRGSELERWFDASEFDFHVEIGVLTTLDIGTFDAKILKVIEQLIAA